MQPITDNSFSEDIRRTKREIAYIEVVHNGFQIRPESYAYDLDRFKFILNNVNARPQDYTVVFKDQIVEAKGTDAHAEIRETYTDRMLKMKSLPMLNQIAAKMGVEVPEGAEKSNIIALILEAQG